MIIYYLWKGGLPGQGAREKLLFFFGFTGSGLFLSRRWPLCRGIHWPKALCSPRYARAVARWLLYRVELYEGLQG